MTSEFLPVIRENAILTLQEMLPRLLPGPADRGTVLFFCQCYRQAGIANFLTYGTTAELFSALHRSGRAFAAFLSAASDDVKLTSQAAPFFDAVASGDDQAAADIASRSRPTWNADAEYEDDFLYVRFLMMMFYLSAGQPELAAILQRYEQVLDGEPDLRWEICRALLADDTPALDTALLELSGEVSRQVQAKIQAGVVTDGFADTERYIWVEGLALIRLARSKGLVVAKDYPLAPSLAQIAVPAAYSADDWQRPGA